MIMTTEFTAVAKLPGVIAAVLSDPSGTVLEASGPIEAEMAGAIHSFVFQALTQAGTKLGFDEMKRISVMGPKQVCVLSRLNGNILGTYVDPSKPQSF